jgi:hypothetical protein
MLTLDNGQQDPKNPEFLRSLGLSTNSLESKNDIVKQALLSAIHAFSARWLPVDWEIKDKVMQQLWSYSHQSVYAAMIRSTYCSILALYLFGITTTSTSNSEREASDLSLAISLRHYKQITLRLRIFSYDSSTRLGQANDAVVNEKALGLSQMQDTAYWFGVICDTSQALIRCQPSILLEAHLDADEIWHCIRKEISEFEERSRAWGTSRLPLSVENIYSIIQHGSAHVVLVWKAITMVQASLFYALEGTTVEKATEIAMTELNRFEEVFGPLLGLCRRDFILLNEKIRISSCTLLCQVSLFTNY